MWGVPWPLGADLLMFIEELETEAKSKESETEDEEEQARTSEPSLEDLRKKAVLFVSKECSEFRRHGDACADGAACCPQLRIPQCVSRCEHEARSFTIRNPKASLKVP